SHRLLLPALLLLTVCGLGLLAGDLAGAQEKKASEFYHDFRGRDVPAELRVFGDPNHQLIRAEPEGLRITLPKDREPRLAVGLRTSFGIQGDFEVTVTYEILHAEEPPSGYGVGAGMFVQREDTSEGATLSRLRRARGKDIVFADRSIQDA